ncbi:hypothetical protein PISL3812_07658 [Talaromyces islandicus]|uniref:Uncharacterized protein n=1 Tax=Talaromyces islandicus TaxID=28573 RepID=A0A0U1M4Y2_TALIS|nr:hypothetical protein PISL3812_07658 [Talaromyces islandicus]
MVVAGKSDGAINVADPPDHLRPSTPRAPLSMRRNFVHLPCPETPFFPITNHPRAYRPSPPTVTSYPFESNWASRSSSSSRTLFPAQCVDLTAFQNDPPHYTHLSSP